MASAEHRPQLPRTQANSVAVLFYPGLWRVTGAPDPDSSIIGRARHGRRETVTQVREVSGVRWLKLASGGWVRERHEEFMEWRWPDDQRAIGYYGWHPSGLVSDKMIAAAERDWRVPVPIAVGGWHSGYSYMAHPNLMPF
ncbi:hypothetical protein OEZ85_011937 [Tetradesmus obliquus]|uniref:Uncharacterized protein n=1 Tax=Tetradesmus obliquus TaxID=3088 RepID=A0ABY8TRZ2_TETOB|nr:hypothetical protein OEZ85_011937 [Tetradesmus obliquus]